MKTTTVTKAVVVTLLLTVRLTSPLEQSDAREEELNVYQPPDKVMDAIGVEPGMVVGEIGAGHGRYVVHLAARVGENGTIYANDVDEHALAYIKRRCKRDGINNVVTVLGKVADPHFPPSRLDIVFMINTYHHLNEPVEIMKNTIPALRPGGILAVVEHDPQKMGNVWTRHATPKEVLLKQAKQAGYALVRLETFLPRDTIYVFQPIAYKRPME